jgi:hypothetical protein
VVSPLCGGDKCQFPGMVDFGLCFSAKRLFDGLGAGHSDEQK